VLQETSDAPLQVITAPHTSAGPFPALCLLNMTRRLQTRLCLMHSFLLEYLLLEPGKGIMVSRLKTIFFSTMGTLFSSGTAPRSSALFSFGILCPVGLCHSTRRDVPLSPSPLPRLLRSSTGRICNPAASSPFKTNMSLSAPGAVKPAP
jgi:hypothetical protein